MREALLIVSGILDALKVGHCLIGGLAVSVHGIPRFTDDVDFLVSAGIKKFQDELRRMVEERGGSCRYIKAHRGDPLGDMFLLSIGEVKVDLVTEKHPYERQCLERARREQFEGASLPIVAPEDLIIIKLADGGPQDLYDVAGILEVSGDSLDTEYLKQQVARWSLENEWDLARSLTPG